MFLQVRIRILTVDMADSSQNLHSKRCCNLLGKDGHVGKNLRNISQGIFESYPNLHPLSKICHTCRKSIYNSHKDLSFEGNSRDYMEFDDSLNEPPNKGIRESSSKNDSIEDMKFDDSLEELACKSREEQLEELLNGLKKKFLSLSENDPMRTSILTIAPDCWSIRTIMEEFKCSYRLAKNSKDLKNSGGVLSVPPFKRRKNIDEETVSKVIEFYENDTNGRIMPHKKEVIKVKIDGVIVSKQKHLLLYDVKVLHFMFKEKYPEHLIGSSKFAELRPKWCVLAGSSGTHSVCICTTHQNVKLMLDAINLKFLSRDSEFQLCDYKDCFKFIQCKKPTTDCHLLQCNKCPNTEKLSDFLLELLKKNKIEQVIFSTWQSTDRCTLKQECLPSDEFIEVLCDRIKVLITHSFISNEQTKFISDKRENLKENEILLHCDFAENYAYVAQDAAQAFHYNNDQCSVFTVAFYYRSNTELKHHNMILLSDCTTHDATAVYLMQQKVIPIIKMLCPKSTKIYYISDGAKQHFKNRTQMMHLAHHKTDFQIDAEWHVMQRLMVNASVMD